MQSLYSYIFSLHTKGSKCPGIVVCNLWAADYQQLINWNFLFSLKYILIALFTLTLVYSNIKVHYIRVYTHTQNSLSVSSILQRT
jgi:hypothetical protein